MYPGTKNKLNSGIALYKISNLEGMDFEQSGDERWKDGFIWLIPPHLNSQVMKGGRTGSYG